MTNRIESFSVEESPRIDIRISSGRVSIVEGSDGIVEVTASGRNVGELVIEQQGSTVSVRQPSGRSLRGSVGLSVAVGSDAEIEGAVASADFEIKRPIADLRLSLASGDVIGRAVDRDVTIKAASGDISLRQIGGRARITSASGDVRIESLQGFGAFSTASGDVSIGHAGGDIKVKTASGDLSLESFSGEELDCKTISGDSRVGLPSGRRIEVDLQTMSGSARLPEKRTDEPESSGDPMRLRFRSISGDIRLERS